VLTVRRGATASFLIVDAKYRTTRDAVLDAMASAHIYQDSLRLGSTRPIASLLAVPSVKDADWLSYPQFVAEHKVGIFELSTGQTCLLPTVLQEMIQGV
jgi:hypothetical protein